MKFNKLGKTIGLGKKAPNLSKFKRLEHDDDDMLDEKGSTKHLGFFTSQAVNTCITVPIDEAVMQPVYYRQVAHAISNLGEDDAVQYEINSAGGDLSGLIALLTAMKKTEAISIANINGEAHSAASMLALNCDTVYVSPYATMLCHFISTGYVGKSSDIKSFINHISAMAEQLFRESYEHFLTEDEINQCINGVELWLNADEIARRLEYKYSILNAEEDTKVTTGDEVEVTVEEEEEWSNIPAVVAPPAIASPVDEGKKVRPKKK